jgi:hypothetical protein
MPVHADSEENEIQSSCMLDSFVVPSAMQIHVIGMKLSVEEVDLILRDVDVVE